MILKNWWNNQVHIITNWLVDGV